MADPWERLYSKGDSESSSDDPWDRLGQSKSKGLVSQFSDWWGRNMTPEFDWFKKLRDKTPVNPYQKELDAARNTPWSNATRGEYGGIGSEREAANVVSSMVGSPQAVTQTALSVAVPGTGKLAGLPSLARVAAPVAKGTQLADRVFNTGAAVSQVPAFSQAMRKGEVGKAIGSGLGIGMGILGARGVKEHSDVAGFPKGPKPSFTLRNPNPGNLSVLEAEGHIPGPVMPKGRGQMIIGDDRVPELPPGTEGPLQRPTMADNLAKEAVEIPYAPTRTVPKRDLVRDDKGKPILDAEGKKQYVPGTKKVTSPKDFPEIFKKWANGRRAADYESAVAKKQFADLDKNPLFLDDGAGNLSVNKTGLAEALDKTKDYFDRKYSQLTGAGKQLGYRESYLPQMWNNSAEEVAAAFGKNSRLALKKGFELKRVIKDYETGIAAGLKPKFDKVSDIVAFYEKHANKAIQDKNFFDYLKNSGLISNKGTVVGLDGKRVPGKVIESNIFPTVQGPKGSVIHWQAAPEVQKAITEFLEAKPEGNLRKVNRFLKTTALAAGVPFTGINIHGISIAARDAMADPNRLTKFATNLKNLATPESGAQYIGENLKHSADAVRDGLQLSTEHIPFRAGEAGHYNNVYSEWAGKTFEDPLFQKVMPAMKLERYNAIKTDLIAKGIAREEAGQLAAQQTNQIFGGIDFKTMVAQDKTANARMKFLFDKHEGWWLAPQWLASQGYIGKDIAKAILNPNDPRGRVYQQMASNVGALYTYANVTNKVLSGHWMGENERGKYFEIDTGQTDSKGKKVYVAPFGTGADFVRIPVEIIGNLAREDYKGFSNIARGRLGPLAQIASSVAAQENWQGKPLKTPKDYLNLGSDYLPPFARAGMNLFNEKQSLPQTFSEAVELPFRFRAKEKKR